jgi:hypothetical protein
MMRRLMIGLGALCCSVPTAAHAQNWDAGGFTITTGDDNCVMTNEFEFDGRPDVQFAVLYDGDSVFISVASSGWSNKDGDEYRDIVYFFRNPDRLYTGGVSRGFVHGYLYKGFGTFLNVDALDALASAQSLVIGRDGEGDDDFVLVTHVNLSGSSAAVASLKRCTAQVQRANAERARREQRWDHIEKDPFKAPAD